MLNRLNHMAIDMSKFNVQQNQLESVNEQTFHELKETIIAGQLGEG